MEILSTTLGQMVGSGRNYLVVTPWLSLVPAAVIVILSYCVQQIGEWMRDEINRQTMIDSLEEKYHGGERVDRSEGQIQI